MRTPNSVNDLIILNRLHWWLLGFASIAVPEAILAAPKERTDDKMGSDLIAISGSKNREMQLA